MCAQGVNGPIQLQEAYEPQSCRAPLCFQVAFTSSVLVLVFSLPSGFWVLLVELSLSLFFFRHGHLLLGWLVDTENVS
jgi:hypothetical protein